MAGHSDRLSPFPENHDSDCDIRPFTVQLTVLRYSAGSSVLHSWVRVRDHVDRGPGSIVPGTQRGGPSGANQGGSSHICLVLP